MEQDALLDGLDEPLPEPDARPDRHRPIRLKDDHGKYNLYMRNEPAWKVSEVQVDPATGRRFQWWLISLTRSAGPDRRQREQVWLDPYPHILKDQDIPLRGWYKSKFEPTGIRARPCYTDALLTQPYGGTCPVGCAFCLSGDSPLDTPFGPRRIDSLAVGDLLWGRVPGGFALTSVAAIAIRSVAGYYRLRTEDAEFKITGDHPVFLRGKGWTPAAHLEPGDAVETASLPTLRADRPAPQPTRLRRTRVSAGRQGIAHDRQHQRRGAQGPAQVGRDPRPDAGRVPGPTREPGQGSAEVPGLADRAGRADSGRQGRIPYVQADALHPARRPGHPVPLDLGGPDGRVVRPQGNSLGVRAPRARARPGSLLARLLAPGPRSVRRGQRRPAPGRQGQAGPFPGRLPDRPLGRADAPRPGYSRVRSIEFVAKPLTVWDVQTDTENFYCRGHLLHNCYINNGNRGYRGAGVVVVDPAYPDKIRRQVAKMRTATAFYLSSFTDPFQPLEDLYHNTERTARVALDNGLPMFFLTRRQVPGWAFDFLKANPYSYMQFSINTPDPDDWARLSPKAIPLPDMFDQVRAMKRAGIYVSIQVNPICSGVVSDDDICQLIHRLAAAGADHLIFKFVEIVLPARRNLVAQMHARFGPGKDPRSFPYDRAAAFDALFTQVIGGVYTIAEEYRLAALDRFARECKKARVTMALCYEYAYARNPDGTIRDKTGVSIGAQYLTADQCHGHRVPVFTRARPGDPWQEIVDCPPSGCLTCADQFAPAAVPCHNPVLADAPAWTPATLRQPALVTLPPPPTRPQP